MASSRRRSRNLTSPLRHAVVRLAPGWVGLLGSSAGLRRLVLPQASREQALFQLGSYLQGTVYLLSPFDALLSRLEAYFERREVAFDDKLDLAGASPFQLRVWELARSIPRGQSRSYSWVAERAGCPHAARAVGQALGANPVPIIIPCHRVVRRDGTEGGFSGGPAMKRYLLDLEQGAAHVGWVKRTGAGGVGAGVRGPARML